MSSDSLLLGGVKVQTNKTKVIVCLVKKRPARVSRYLVTMISPVFSVDLSTMYSLQHMSDGGLWCFYQWQENSSILSEWTSNFLICCAYLLCCCSCVATICDTNQNVSKHPCNLCMPPASVYRHVKPPWLQSEDAHSLWWLHQLSQLN